MLKCGREALKAPQVSGADQLPVSATAVKVDENEGGGRRDDEECGGRTDAEECGGGRTTGRMDGRMMTSRTDG